MRQRLGKNIDNFDEDRLVWNWILSNFLFNMTQPGSDPHEGLDPDSRRIRIAGFRFKTRILDKRSTVSYRYRVQDVSLPKLQYYGTVPVRYRYLGDVIRVLRYWPVRKLLSVWWSGVVGVADIHHTRVSACGLRQPNGFQSSRDRDSVTNILRGFVWTSVADPYGLMPPRSGSGSIVRNTDLDPSITKQKSKKNLKGAQVWDFRPSFFYTNKSYMGRWLEDWIIFFFEDYGRYSPFWFFCACWACAKKLPT